MEKYCGVGQATDCNMAHAHYMLDTKGYKYTRSGCVILIDFSIATMVARTRLYVTLYVHCLYCYYKAAKEAP